VLRVRRCGPRFTLRGPRACGLASMHTATVLAFNRRVLTRRAFARFGKAPLARPVGAEPCGVAIRESIFLFN